MTGPRVVSIQDTGEARFEYDFPTGTLRWSTAMQHLYGYRGTPADVSLALLRSHKHPADLPRMDQLLGRMQTNLKPYVFEHRIITAVDTMKTIVVSAFAVEVRSDRAVVVSGTAVDLSATHRGASFADEPSVGHLLDRIAHLNEALDSRDVIGRAKGILMERYKISDRDAFELLTLASQRTNRKLRDVSDHLSATGELQTE